MKIVADENIPLVGQIFDSSNELLLKPGRDIQRDDLVDADILLVRSVTRVNRDLLNNTSVKFVGSVTSGADHLDTVWLDEKNIAWCVAEGCNAKAVAEYVVCVVAALQNNQFLQDKKIRAAVVGVGRIGEIVARYFQLLGFEVVLCDPFRQDISTISFESLTDFDLVSFHTPLTRTGTHPTFHLVQKTFLERQKEHCILLNAGRGEVFDFDSLKKVGQSFTLCLDVWEQEPMIDADMLNQAWIATPHIAGYSVQARYRGMDMILRAMMACGILKQNNMPDIQYPVRQLSVESARSWRDVVLKIFDPVALTAQMKKTLGENPAGFDAFRKTFVDKFEFGYVKLEHVKLSDVDPGFLKKLGI